jgi:hypothetical protein
MLYIDPQGNYPRYYGDIISANPDWVLGADLPDGWQFVADSEPPVYGDDEIIQDGFPEFVDGILTRTFVVRSLTEEELEARNAPRTAREKLELLGFSSAEITAIARGII